MIVSAALQPLTTSGTLSNKLINVVVRESEQDKMFAEDAKEAGLDVETFRLEHFALRVSSAILVMRYVLPGPLWEDFVKNARASLLQYMETLGSADKIPRIVHSSRGFQNLDEFVLSRLFEYASVVDSSGRGKVSENVGSFFANMCSGSPSNATLCRIGDSTYLVRGHSILEISRRLKFVAQGS